MPRMHFRLALAAAAGLVLGACAMGGPAELTEQQACLEHNKNDPAARERCYQSPDLRTGSPPDARPQDLPVRSGQVSD
jgi:hypothetical protein